MAGFTDADVPDQSGKCFLVTGANTGLGFETARVLARKGGRVLLGCRDQAKAEAALARIREDVSGADIAFIPIDQADLASVRRAAELVGQEPRLDVLVNNAGVMASTVAFTKDGFEQHIGINHLGTFALTLLLLPKLAQTAGARVVLTSSLVHKTGRLDLENLQTGTGAKPSQLYANSKLANLLFLFELDRRLKLAGKDVTAVGCHPGLAATDLSRDLSPFLKMIAPVMSKLVNSALQGAWPTLQAATDPAIRAGEYYGPQKMGEAKGPSGPAKRAKQASSPELARQLWDASVTLTGVDWPAPQVAGPAL